MPLPGEPTLCRACSSEFEHGRSTCPHCGARTGYVNRKANVALALAMAGLVIWPLAGLAVFFAVTSRRELRADPVQGGRTRATVALVLGVVASAYGGVIIAGLFLLA